MTIKTFYHLDSWKVSHELVLNIYRKTDNFPRKEQYSLADQLRRAAVSITSNIAEGFSRYGYADKVRFYYISRGSISEVQNQLIIAKDLSYIKKEEFEELFIQTITANKLVNGLIRGCKSNL